MSQHSGVRLIDARDEGAALLMADGWARPGQLNFSSSGCRSPKPAGFALAVATKDIIARLNAEILKALKGLRH